MERWRYSHAFQSPEKASITQISVTKRQKPAQGISQSERDWAYVREQLRRGADPGELRAELERRRQDKPCPRYYAQRTVDRAVRSFQERSR